MRDSRQLGLVEEARIFAPNLHFRQLLLVLVVLTAGCVKVGPNFHVPAANVAQQWLEMDNERLNPDREIHKQWWKSFNDPILDKLIELAYAQNLSLQVAGVRVLEARAQLGISVGNLYPQTQLATGAYNYNRLSKSSPLAPQTPQPGIGYSYSEAQIGAQASWELDFWGRYRRGVESADASLLSSLAAYDNALVSLIGDVSSNYVNIRTIEERIKIAYENVKAQDDSLKIAEARFQGGATSERDVQQAITQLKSTQAQIPQLETSLRQAKNSLSVLLGLPPSSLEDLLSGSSTIPKAPVEILVGIPADLLRRRPDIRSAEFQAAAQCAQIGVAKADLYPAFSLIGNFGFLSSDVGNFALGDLFAWKGETAAIGPSVQWKILNYGQITNNVRVQDAKFQELLLTYQNTVLQAQREVEDGLVSFLNSQEVVRYYTEAVAAAKRTVDLSLIQYREGATDYTTVITALQALLNLQDNLAAAQGNVPQGMVSIYRALGGGWEIRQGGDIVPADIKQEMRERTNWGDLMAHPTSEPPQLGNLPLQKPDW